ncbi:Retrovirus-related Pol polyprotein [Stylophora pistillata]|uniref:Retrovirus-related Pol polyprotein n=1 Tax=Stylophora pistillata TaxID=50429 RepID=A0A2B4RZP8_STYPI|nr:Retrovirus-related Pol polyprotein [Stylophora pistillata]
MKLSENCGFGTLRESLIRDRLILGVKDDRIREKLLGKRDFDLDKAVKMIKASQVTHSRASESAGEASAQEDVNAVKHKPQPQRKSEKGKLPKSSTRNPSSNSKIKECRFCGGKHALDRKLCPASGQTWIKCGKVGHFSVKCRGKSENVNVIYVENFLDIINIGGKDQALVPVTLNNTVSITFQIDIGSSANFLPLEGYIRATNDIKTASIIPKDITLVVHDHSERKALGSARLKVEHDGNKHELNFVIVDQRVTPLLGLKSCTDMGLVKIMVPGVHAPVNNVVATPKKAAVSESITTDSVVRPFADVFQGIGCLPGGYSISLHRDVSPVVHPLRRVPVPKKDAMKAELENLVSNQIIAPVTEPTKAVTPAEGRYAQIEKELLSVVFAWGSGPPGLSPRIRRCLYGRDIVHVMTDHQPLEAICKKDLASAPKRLQRKLLRLQRYNIDVKYQKGENRVKSDPLSRAYVDEPCSQTVCCSEVEEIVLVDDLLFFLFF